MWSNIMGFDYKFYNYWVKQECKNTTAQQASESSFSHISPVAHRGPCGTAFMKHCHTVRNWSSHCGLTRAENEKPVQVRGQCITEHVWYSQSWSLCLSPPGWSQIHTELGRKGEEMTACDIFAEAQHSTHQSQTVFTEVAKLRPLLTSGHLAR